MKGPVLLVVLWAVVGGAVEWISNLHLLDFLDLIITHYNEQDLTVYQLCNIALITRTHNTSDVFVVNRFFDVQTTRGNAVLSLVEEDATEALQRRISNVLTYREVQT